MKGSRGVGDKSTRKSSNISVSWNSRLTSTLKRGSMALSLFLLISLTIASFAIHPTFAKASAANAAAAIVAELNGQLNICHAPDPCVMATFQANASGPDAEDLTGMLLISHAAEINPPQPCMAAVTGNVASLPYAPTATLMGTLSSVEPAASVCVGGLQGISVTLFVDSMYGMVRLTTVSSSGVTEFLASGTGSLTIAQALST